MNKEYGNKKKTQPAENNYYSSRVAAQRSTFTDTLPGDEIESERDLSEKESIQIK